MRGECDAAGEVRRNRGAMQPDVAHLPPREPQLQRDGHTKSEQKKEREKIDEAEHGSAWISKVSGKSIEQAGSEADDEAAQPQVAGGPGSFGMRQCPSILRQVAEHPRCRRTQP